MDMHVNTVRWGIVERDAYGRVVDMTAWCGPQSSDVSHRILVPVDGFPASTDATRIAAQMADAIPRVELHLLNVQTCLGNNSQDDTLEYQGLRETRPARNSLDQTGRPYLLRLTAGSPAEVILKYTRNHDIAEIVMGSHGAGRMERLFIGSVAMDVAEQSPVPVTLVKAGDQAGRFSATRNDWLVPCDGSLNTSRALMYVLRHCENREHRPLIHLLNVQKRPWFSADQDWQLPGTSPKDANASYQQQGALLCDEAITMLNEARLDYRFHVDLGDPIPTILEAADSLNCGRIIMGSRGLGLFGKIALGSVSNGVAHRIHIPMTIVN